MYGLVNRCARDLIIQVAGEAVWQEVRNRVGIPDEDFLTMKTYPDSVTYDIVGAASEILDVPAPELLRQFGRHWITYTAEEGYGEMMKLWGGTLPEFLANLNAMHSRIRLTMPELKPPVIEVHEAKQQALTLRYWSERPGLEHMVVGLLEGLGERFQVKVEVTLTKPKTEQQDYAEFQVVWQPSDALA